MDVNYIYADSTIKPQSVEVCKNTVYLRNDVVEQKRIDEQGESHAYWTYQEAKFTLSEFQAYANLILSRNAIVGMNDSGNISKLVSGQENEDTNLLILMAAIADLYDVLATLL